MNNIEKEELEQSFIEVHPSNPVSPPVSENQYQKFKWLFIVNPSSQYPPPSYNRYNFDSHKGGQAVFPWMRTTGFTATASRQVCAPGTLQFSHPYICPFLYWLLTRTWLAEISAKSVVCFRGNFVHPLLYETYYWEQNPVVPNLGPLFWKFSLLNGRKASDESPCDS